MLADDIARPDGMDAVRRQLDSGTLFHRIGDSERGSRRRVAFAGVVHFDQIDVVLIAKQSGRFDDQMASLMNSGHDDETVAWELTDQLVASAQEVFLPVWEETRGNDGYVSFEVDPLLEDLQLGPPHEERVARYIELGKK